MNWTCNKPCFLPSQNGLKAQILLLHVHFKTQLLLLHEMGSKPKYLYFIKWAHPSSTFAPDWA